MEAAMLLISLVSFAAIVLAWIVAPDGQPDTAPKVQPVAAPQPAAARA
jgi:hypothetical protein